MNNHPQQQEETIRQWHLVEVGGDRCRSVLLMREMSPTPIHLSSGDDLNGFSCNPMLSAPVPIIKVKFETMELGQVLITKFESLYEKQTIVHGNKIKAGKNEESIEHSFTYREPEMQKQRRELTHGPSKYWSHKIVMEQQHEESKNLELLRAAYLSMNANICGSNWNFSVPDWVDRSLASPEIAIYKQRSPQGNTVLHLAASYGNNGIVRKVAEHAPHLFITRNSNDDTALHVAARAGHASTIQMLLNAYFPIATLDKNYAYNTFRMNKSVLDLVVMLSLTLLRNNQGNTFLHEAFMVNSHNGAKIFQAFEAPFIAGNSQFEGDFKAALYQLAVFASNNEDKSLLYLAIEVGCQEVVNRLMDICVQFELEPQGKSPLLLPIIKRDKDMLETILSKKPNWIHLKDEEGRFPLHYAANVGYLEGVSYLIKKCASCTIECDNYGFFPLHLASGGGHIEVVQEMLKWCPDPTEMLDEDGRNILHIAAGSGNCKVVSYILQHPKLEKMINQKDKNGDTPLHWATRNWHPKIVHALMWDKRVNLALPNQHHQTALDIADQTHFRSPSISQFSRKEAGRPELYKDRIDTLIVVSTLIITASFAAGFTVPGEVEEGKTVMLNQHMFHLFIFSITLSMFGSIGTTIILIWARLGEHQLTLDALKSAMSLLGITLGSLSLAFLAGLYLVVSKLSWLASAFLAMGVLMVFMVLLLYTLLCFSSLSTFPILRCVSYFYFIMLARLAIAKTNGSHKGSSSSSSLSEKLQQLGWLEMR